MNWNFEEKAVYTVGTVTTRQYKYKNPVLIDCSGFIEIMSFVSKGLKLEKQEDLQIKKSAITRSDSAQVDFTYEINQLFVLELPCGQGRASCRVFSKSISHSQTVEETNLDSFYLDHAIEEKIIASLLKDSQLKILSISNKEPIEGGKGLYDALEQVGSDLVTKFSEYSISDIPIELWYTTRGGKGGWKTKKAHVQYDYSFLKNFPYTKKPTRKKVYELYQGDFANWSTQYRVVVENGFIISQIGSCEVVKETETHWIGKTLKVAKKSSRKQ